VLWTDWQTLMSSLHGVSARARTAGLTYSIWGHSSRAESEKAVQLSPALAKLTVVGLTMMFRKARAIT